MRLGGNGDLKAGKCYSQILLQFKRLFRLKYISKRKTARTKINMMPVRRGQNNSDYTWSKYKKIHWWHWR